MITIRWLYTQTLLSDPRWKGPFLAVALLIGNQARPSGEGQSFRVQTIGRHTGIGYRGVQQIIRALIEQGYLIRTGGGSYLLTALQPAIDQREATPGDTWLAHAPATAWLAEEKARWIHFEIEREAVWRARAEVDSENWGASPNE